MADSSFTPSERQQIIARLRTAQAKLYGPGSATAPIDTLRPFVQQEEQALEEYGERMPFVPVSRCPICDEVLEYPMDSLGLDGPWWFKGPLAEYPQPDACEHFQVLLGAINFQNSKPTEAAVNKLVYPGPAVPFVVPELLELPTMKAVISSITIGRGYLAYPIAYFAKQKFHGALLHQPWGREAYQVKDASGNYEGWAVSTAVWDFDLEPWIAKGLLLWINPGDSTLKLQTQPPCPYVNRSGVRQPQAIVNGVIELLPLPNGQPLAPFE